MPIFDLYSKRLARQNGDVPDVYQYDEMPEALRVQVLHIWDDTLGTAYSYDQHRYGVTWPRECYKFIVDTLRREYGVLTLPRTSVRQENFRDELRQFFFSARNTTEALDVIELSFHVITNYFASLHITHSKLAVETVEELNTRFRQHGVGYQYEDGTIIRMDSELIHKEVVKGSLLILSQRHLEGAREEFLAAFRHYRAGEPKETMNYCLKSFESTMKAICENQGWSYPSKPTAKQLIDVMIAKGLIPSFWQTSVGNLRSLLESTVPTGRNVLSGHGQGSVRVMVPDHVVSFMLHTTAATIVFLGDAEKAIP